MYVYLQIIKLITIFSGAVFRFIVIGFVILAIFRFLSIYVPVWLKKQKFVAVFSKVFPVVELMIWLIFLMRQLDVFMQQNQMIAYSLMIILFAIVLLLSWFGLRDIAAGIIFRAAGRFAPNDMVVINKYKGRLQNYHLMTIEVETDSGETIFIPYHKALNKSGVKSDPADILGHYTFTLNVAAQKELKQTIHDIRTTIINMPWTSGKSDPKINIVEVGNKNYKLDITVYSIEKIYLFKIENTLQQKYAANKIKIPNYTKK